jgi:hypothetical protein
MPGIGLGIGRVFLRLRLESHVPEEAKRPVSIYIMKL